MSMKRFFFVSAVLISIASIGVSAPAEAPVGYTLDKTVEIKGDGGWDYLTVDPIGRRVYISHSTCVEVLDADTGELKGQVTGGDGVHGIAIASDAGKGFISNGKADTVSVFDLKSLMVTATVKVGKKPDAIIFDSTTHRVFAFNGVGASATAIDVADAKVAGTIDLGGSPESAVSDGTGHVYVNLEDKGEVLKLDAKNLRILERWSIAPAKEPVSLAIDAEGKRLFVGCHGKTLVVLSTDGGKTVATLPIGDRVDAGSFDPETKLAFCSCGDGTVTVVRQDTADKYTVVETIKTKVGSRTLALDVKTHKLFLPAAEFKPAEGKNRPGMKPGTFSVLIYKK